MTGTVGAAPYCTVGSCRDVEKMPYESLPPFLIITFGVAGMGALQHGFHKLTNWNNDFKPKRAGYRNGSGMDMWEWQLEKRDEQLLSCDGDWTKFHEKPAADHH